MWHAFFPSSLILCSVLCYYSNSCRAHGPFLKWGLVKVRLWRETLDINVFSPKRPGYFFAKSQQNIKEKRIQPQQAISVEGRGQTPTGLKCNVEKSVKMHSGKRQISWILNCIIHTCIFFLFSSFAFPCTLDIKFLMLLETLSASWWIFVGIAFWAGWNGGAF